MLNREYIGRRLRSVTRTVEAGRLRFFLDTVGDKAQAFANPGDDAALRAPPTYLFCLEMMDDPDPLDWLKTLGVNLLHILHGQQRFDYRAPVFAGDRLTFDASIADIYEKKNGALQFIVKHTEVRNQHDASVATLASTVVYRDPSARTA
jgi:hypothetical protein